VQSKSQFVAVKRPALVRIVLPEHLLLRTHVICVHYYQLGGLGLTFS